MTITALRFAVGFLGQGTAFALGISMISSTSNPDKNFGFVIAAQVAFGVVALFTLRPLVEQYQSIGGMYVPLAVLAALTLLLVKFMPTGSVHQEMAGTRPKKSLALPLTALFAMLIWCCGLGAMWAFIERIGVAGGLESVLALRSLGISSTVAIVGALAASAIAARGINRFMPVTIALLMQMLIAWLLQGEMSWVEMAIKASIFQIFWNMTGPFFMGAIAASGYRWQSQCAHSGSSDQRILYWSCGGGNVSGKRRPDGGELHHHRVLCCFAAHFYSARGKVEGSRSLVCSARVVAADRCSCKRFHLQPGSWITTKL